MKTTLYIKKTGLVYVDTGLEHILCADQNKALELCWRNDERIHGPVSFSFWKSNMLGPGIYSVSGLKWEKHLDVAIMQTDDEMIHTFMGLTIPDATAPVMYSYSTSWGHLMPVVEKISRIKCPDGGTYYPRTFALLDEEGFFMVRFNRSALAEDKVLITAVYKAVVEFIKLYNQQNDDTP